VVVSKRAATAEDYDLVRKWHHAGFRDVVVKQFGIWDEVRQDAFFDDAWTPEATEIIVADGIECGYCVVEHRAKELYARLGFKPTGQTETHMMVSWSPDQQ
jgi:hypothetical protein